MAKVAKVVLFPKKNAVLRASRPVLLELFLGIFHVDAKFSVFRQSLAHLDCIDNQERIGRGSRQDGELER
jgi:hypothetical protein